MVEWTDVEFRIPTVLPERGEHLAELTTQIREQTGQPVWASPQPEGRKPNDRVRRIWSKPVDGKWMMHMNDDMCLASSFGEVVPRVLEETDRKVVSFCDLRDKGHGLKTMDKPFYCDGCVAVRADIVPGFVDFYYNWIEDSEHTCAADIAFGDYTTSLGEPIDVYRPSQAQHKQIPSTFDGRSSQRQSPTFEG